MIVAFSVTPLGVGEGVSGRGRPTVLKVDIRPGVNDELTARSSRLSRSLPSYDQTDVSLGHRPVVVNATSTSSYVAYRSETDVPGRDRSGYARLRQGPVHPRPTLGRHQARSCPSRSLSPVRQPACVWGAPSPRELKPCIGPAQRSVPSDRALSPRCAGQRALFLVGW